jgi:hypothetical protein
MDDDEVLGRINELAREEHELFEHEARVRDEKTVEGYTA